MVTQRLGLEWRHQERHFDDYSLQQLLPLQLSQLGPGLAWSDADGDGLDDLFVGGALFSDADGDGRPDLLLTLEWGPVHLFTNLGGSFADHSQQAGLAERTGWWNSITGGDFNGDGAIDYAVGNLGLNSKYSASPELPTKIYYGDMDGSGEPHLIEASSTAEGPLPVRCRSCASLAMPFVKERFPTYHDYASALLTDIYSDDTLGQAQTFEAVELASGILMNNGEGGFDWRPLPRLAQASPAYGMVASDYNGDGHTDLYLVQNSFSREPETGLLDGGVSILLFGDGSGEFRVSDPSESGLIVPGDGKGLAGGDLNRDGWPDVVLTQNNGPLAAFGNHGVAGNSPLAVRLKGLAGNPAAVGARVTLERSDGHSQTTEIYAGSGYLSQSSPTCFFGLGTDQAKLLRVRWPDGSESQHLAGPGPNITLTHPAVSRAGHSVGGM